MPIRTRAAVADDGQTEFSVEAITLRDPAPTDVVVEIGASAFCYSDWIALRGDAGLAEAGLYPAVLGHAAVGTITHAGADARHRAGARVLITATPQCDRCFWCRSGRVDQCQELFAPAPVIGTRADGTAVRGPGAAATYADRAVIRDIQVFPTVSDLPDAWMAMFGCGVVSGMGAIVNVARVAPGESVVVVGCGQVGLWAIQAARAIGAAQIIALDPIAGRRAMAERLGATLTIDPGDDDAADRVRAATGGRGADHGLDAGGTIASVQDAFAYTRLGGVVTVTSYVTRASEVSFPLFDLALRGRDVRSSQSGRLDMARDMARFLPWFEDGRVDPDALIGGIRPLAEMGDTLAASRDRRELTPLISG